MQLKWRWCFQRTACSAVGKFSSPEMELTPEQAGAQGGKCRMLATRAWVYPLETWVIIFYLLSHYGLCRSSHWLDFRLSPQLIAPATWPSFVDNVTHQAPFLGLFSVWRDRQVCPRSATRSSPRHMLWSINSYFPHQKWSYAFPSIPSYNNFSNYHNINLFI